MMSSAGIDVIVKGVVSCGSMNQPANSKRWGSRWIGVNWVVVGIGGIGSPMKRFCVVVSSNGRVLPSP